MNKISRACTYRPSLSFYEISRNKVNVAEAAFCLDNFKVVFKKTNFHKLSSKYVKDLYF